MITTLPTPLTDPTLRLSARLDAAVLLATAPPSPHGDDRCVALLDLWGPQTPAGLGYREILVTEGVCVAALSVLLWESPRRLRRAAVRRLGELADPVALPDLLGLLGHQLAGLQPRDSVLVTFLLESAVRCWIPGEISVPLAVAGALGDPDEGIRVVAGSLLRRMGGAASVASGQILGLLASPDPRLRLEAAELLPAICPPDAWRVPVQLQLDREPDPLLRWMLQDALDHHARTGLAA